MSIFVKVLFYFVVFIFKFRFSKRNKQAFKVKDALKEKIAMLLYKTILLLYTNLHICYKIVSLLTSFLLTG